VKPDASKTHARRNSDAFNLLPTLNLDDAAVLVLLRPEATLRLKTDRHRWCFLGPGIMPVVIMVDPRMGPVACLHHEARSWLSSLLATRDPRLAVSDHKSAAPTLLAINRTTHQPSIPPLPLRRPTVDGMGCNPRRWLRA
jgi:hypothetical protein